MHWFHLLQLLLGTNVVCVAALLLAAVCGPWMESSITLAADHFVTVVLLSQDTKCWLNHPTTKTQNQVKGRFCWQMKAQKHTVM